MMNLSVTIRLKDIFKTKEEFDNYLKTDVGCSGDFLVFIADPIYYFFVNSNVRYDTDEAFKRHFKITFKNIYKRYEKEHDLLVKAYAITDAELEMIGKQVSILANNDNSEVIEPLDSVLQFVSTQTVNKQTTNRLSAYVEAIDKLSDDVIDYFIDDLRKHFIKVLEPFGYYYCSEEE